MHDAHHRWFRLAFSLRTPLVLITVVGLLCFWLTTVYSWKAERARFIEDRAPASASGMTPAPWALRLLGANGYDWIGVHFTGEFDAPLTDEQEAELTKVRRLFPEAKVEGHVMCESTAPLSPESRRQLEGRLP